MKEKEERIALLEYELRLAKEDVESLRKQVKNLISLQSQEVKKGKIVYTILLFYLMLTDSLCNVHRKGPIQSLENGDSDSESEHTNTEDGKFSEAKAISAQEKRRLNSIVRTYLVNTGYKISAITFNEEV